MAVGTVGEREVRPWSEPGQAAPTPTRVPIRVPVVVMVLGWLWRGLKELANWWLRGWEVLTKRGLGFEDGTAGGTARQNGDSGHPSPGLAA